MENSPDIIKIVWLLTGGLFVFLEAAAIPGIGFLFAGLAAITVGGLLSLGTLAPDSYSTQLAAFFAFSALWAAALWVPLKKFKSRQNGGGFSNIVGDIAVVEGKPLTKKKVGQVKWSGTIMRAKLDAAASADSLNPGDNVVITAMEGNLLTVTLPGEQPQSKGTK